MSARSQGFSYAARPIATVNMSQMLGHFGTGGNATIDGDRKLRIALLQAVYHIVGQRRNFTVFLWAEPM